MTKALEQHARRIFQRLERMPTAERIAVLVAGLETLAADVAEANLPLETRATLCAALAPREWRARLAGVMRGIAENPDGAPPEVH